jgi:hypothetical protein
VTNKLSQNNSSDRGPKYDVAMKSLFGNSRGKIYGIFSGGRKITEMLSEEYVAYNSKQIADKVVRLEDGSVLHIEFQTRDDTDMHWRMLEYYWLIAKAHFDVAAGQRQNIEQIVIYLGRAPSKMIDTINDSSHGDFGIRYRYKLIELINTDPDFFRKLISEKDADCVILSLLCIKGGYDQAWLRVAQEVQRLPEQRAARALLHILVFSLLRPVSDRVKTEIRKMVAKFDVHDEPLFRDAVDHGYSIRNREIVLRRAKIEEEELNDELLVFLNKSATEEEMSHISNLIIDGRSVADAISAIGGPINPSRNDGLER